MINYPRNRFTDFDEADRLYFRRTWIRTFMDIYELESASGVVVSVEV